MTSPKKGQLFTANHLPCPLPPPPPLLPHFLAAESEGFKNESPKGSSKKSSEAYCLGMNNFQENSGRLFYSFISLCWRIFVKKNLQRSSCPLTACPHDIFKGLQSNFIRTDRNLTQLQLFPFLVNSSLTTSKCTIIFPLDDFTSTAKYLLHKP